MARPDQEVIETFMSITGASESVAIEKLAEYAGNLNEAINAHFSEGDGNTGNETSVAVPQDDLMDIDDPIQVESRRPPFSLFPSGLMNPFSLLDPNIRSSIFNRVPDLTSPVPFVSHPREVREIPIEVKDGNGQSGYSRLAPTIEDVTGTTHDNGSETQGTVIIDEEDDEEIPPAPRPTAPGIDDIPDNNNSDIEEEMIRAAIEASKRDAESGYPSKGDPIPHQMQSHVEDPELARAVSLSLKTAEQEKVLRELGDEVGPLELEASTSTEVENIGKLNPSKRRFEPGGSSMQEKTDEAEEQPLVRHRSRPISSNSFDNGKESGEIDFGMPPNPQRDTSNSHLQHNENDSHLDVWGGISSMEHDEAVMLEAALLGGVHDGNAYGVPYAPHRFMQNDLGETIGSYPRPMPRPPSPSLTAQRLIREEQDDEYLASLQADREKELKAVEEGEIRQLEKKAAREAALVEERQKQEELHKRLEEEQEMERQLAAKETSLPHEPSPDDSNAVNLLVRMPDGSRLGRRFLKSHKLQYLFDFIDVGQRVRPGAYRLVRPYPRHAFSDGESASTFEELGLTSRQEALFLELI